eukprot:6251155-Prymnesium_polylepis.2
MRTGACPSSPVRGTCRGRALPRSRVRTAPFATQAARPSVASHSSTHDWNHRTFIHRIEPHTLITREDSRRSPTLYATLLAADHVLFDSSLVASLESSCSLAGGASSRPSTGNCVTISNPNRASCREVCSGS